MDEVKSSTILLSLLIVKLSLVHYIVHDITPKKVERVAVRTVGLPH